LAKELLSKNKKSVEIGSLAPIEIKTAEAEVATREADILEAEALIRNNIDNLRTIINLNAGRGDPDIDILPTDKPESEKKGVSLEEAIRIAFKERPDLKESKLDIKNKDLDLTYAKNQLMPGLDLQASYWSPGISGTRILYLDDNPLTNVIIGTLPGKSSESMNDALRFLYNNWSVSLVLSVPLSSIISRADVAQALVSLKQSKLGLREKEQQILLEIKNSVRDVETNFKRVHAYRIARELTEEKLRAEEEKLRVGLSTNYDLLLAQRDFANARSSELKAIVDYSVSLANQEKVLGISLDKKNIRMKETK
jgi:outer membrane protein TolC